MSHKYTKDFRFDGKRRFFPSPLRTATRGIHKWKAHAWLSVSNTDSGSFDPFDSTGNEYGICWKPQPYSTSISHVYVVIPTSRSAMSKRVESLLLLEFNLMMQEHNSKENDWQSILDQRKNVGIDNSNV